MTVEEILPNLFFGSARLPERQPLCLPRRPAGAYRHRLPSAFRSDETDHHAPWGCDLCTRRPDRQHSLPLRPHRRQPPHPRALGCEIALHRVGKHFIDARDGGVTWWRYYDQEAEFFSCTRGLENGNVICRRPLRVSRDLHPGALRRRHRPVQRCAETSHILRRTLGEGYPGNDPARGRQPRALRRSGLAGENPAVGGPYGLSGPRPAFCRSARGGRAAANGGSGPTSNGRSNSATTSSSASWSTPC